MDVEKLRQQLQEYGQEHLLQFWPQLDEDERQELVRSIQEINLAEVIKFFRHTIQSANNDEEKLDEHLQPIRTIIIHFKFNLSF